MPMPVVSARGFSHAKAGLVVLMLGLVAAGAGISPVRGQPKDGDLSLFLNTRADPTKPDKEVKLRPNVLQHIYVYVKNDTAKERTVTVQLLSAGQIVTAQEVKAIAGKSTPVPFGLPIDAPKAAPMAALSGSLLFRMVEGKAEVGGRPVSLSVAAPREYVQRAKQQKDDKDVIRDAKWYSGNEKNGESGRVEVEVQRNPAAEVPFGPPACRVSLDLSRVLGLAPTKREGTYSGYLPGGRNQSLLLQAKNLRIEKSNGKRGGGFVSLTVDDYPGALVFVGRFEPTQEVGETLTPVTAPVCTLRALLTRPNAKFPVVLETDGVITEDYKLRLGLRAGSDEKTPFADVEEFATPRETAIRYARGGPAGSLVFQPEVKYWTAQIDLSAAVGRNQLRLQIIDTAEKDAPLQKMLDGSRPDQPAQTSIVRDIIVDDSAPEDAAFVDLPKQVTRGKSFTLKATAFDKESAIQSVRMYLGKAYPDGKTPPETVSAPGEYDPLDENWTASFPVPADQKTPLQVNALFTNGVGLMTTKSAEIPVVDPPPTSTTITGKVLDASVPVENILVYLVSPKYEIQDRVQSGKGGVYTFTGVTKGSYRLIARRKDPKASANLPLTVKELSPPFTDVDLILKPSVTVSGRVLEGETPVDNLVVQLVKGKSDVAGQVRTAGGGKFTFEDVPDGDYKVTATRPATKARAELPVSVKKAKPVANLELILDKRARIEGTVVEGNRLQAGITVHLINANSVILKSATTDENGKYELTEVEKGSYRLFAQKGGGSRSRAVKPIEVDFGQELKDVELKLLRQQR